MSTSLEQLDLQFDIENQIKELPCICRPSLYHYGSESNYQRFRFSYFITNIYDPNEDIIYKHIITDVKYQPDSVYSTCDGYFGKCWVVTINDAENNETDKYYIRNWIDIVEYYKEKGLKFVEE